MFSKQSKKRSSKLPLQTSEEEQKKLHAQSLEQQSKFSNPLMTYKELHSLAIVEAQFGKKPKYTQSKKPGSKTLFKKNKFLLLVKRFELALTQRPIDLDLVITLWLENLSLRSWYGSKEVDIGNLNFQTIPILDLVCLSQYVLLYPWEFKYIFETMMHGSLELQNWFKGLPVNLGIGASQEIAVLSLNDVFLNFKAILQMKHHRIIEILFFGSSKLQTWLQGTETNFGNEILPNIRPIPLEQVIDNFKLVLKSQCTEVIEAIYNNTPALQVWIKGEELNFGTDFMPDIQVISFDELVLVFQLLIKSKSLPLIEIIFEIPELRGWLRGLPIHFGSEAISGIHSVYTKHLFKTFELVLRSTYVYLSDAMFVNPLLRSWIKGLPLSSHPVASNISGISTKNLIKFFQSTVKNKHVQVFETMFEIPKVQTWLKGLSLDFGTENTPNLQNISNKQAIKNFQSILKMNNKRISEKLFDLSPLLKTWILGKPINYDETLTIPDTRIPTFDELRKQFHLILNSGSMKLIMTMWETNKRIIPLINQLKLHQSEKLLSSVLHLNIFSIVERKFIHQYVNSITDITLIKKTLDNLNIFNSDLEENELSVRRTLLTNHIYKLELLDQKSITNAPKQNVHLEKNLLNKRKAPNKIQTPRKKQRKGISDKELCELVSSLPVQFNCNNKSCIEGHLGRTLQNLPKELKKNMGISVYKIREKTDYMLKILDTQKYYAFLEKHTFEFYDLTSETNPLIPLQNNPITAGSDLVSRDVNQFKFFSQLINTPSCKNNYAANSIQFNK